MKKTNNGIVLYFSPKMVHTKLIIADDIITFGSANITKKAFKQLNELNLCITKDDCTFVNELIESINDNYALSTKVTNYKDINYNSLLAFVEGFIV